MRAEGGLIRPGGIYSEIGISYGKSKTGEYEKQSSTWRSVTGIRIGTNALL